MKKIILFLVLFSVTILFAKTLKVMVIDTGLNIKNKEIMKYVPKTYKVENDYHGHGTHIAGLVIKNACNKIELYPCSYYFLGLGGGTDEIISCIEQGIELKVDIINLSSGGTNYSEKEKQAIKKFLDTKRTNRFISAGGNRKSDLNKFCSYYPTCYRLTRMTAVGALDKNGKIAEFSNYAPWLKWELGENVLSWYDHKRKIKLTGTSQATAIHTGKIIEQWCKDK